MTKYSCSELLTYRARGKAQLGRLRFRLGFKISDREGTRNVY